uniref:MD-2-related lipid-recognition domain-containing protein n=1 Tax=Heliothis virescens TaxID=7102 RepID=A0A2A4JD07_HELVI
MMRAVVLFCVAVLSVKGQTTPVSQCTANPAPLPINTYIEGCIETPCILPQGQDAVINIIFRAPRVIRRMETLAAAFLPPLINNQPYPLGENAVTCNFLENTYCPIVKGEVIKYTLKMHIEMIFPRIPVTIEFRIVDENQESVLCIRVPIRVVGPVNTLASNNATLTDV